MQNTESVGMIANDVLIEVLESYMEFVKIVKIMMMAQGIDQTTKALALDLCKQKLESWKPILEQAKERRKNV